MMFNNVTSILIVNMTIPTYIDLIQELFGFIYLYLDQDYQLLGSSESPFFFYLFTTFLSTTLYITVVEPKKNFNPFIEELAWIKCIYVKYLTLESTRKRPREWD